MRTSGSLGRRQRDIRVWIRCEENARQAPNWRLSSRSKVPLARLVGSAGLEFSEVVVNSDEWQRIGPSAQQEPINFVSNCHWCESCAQRNSCMPVNRRLHDSDECRAASGGPPAQLIGEPLPRYLRHWETIAGSNRSRRSSGRGEFEGGQVSAPDETV